MMFTRIKFCAAALLWVAASGTAQVEPCRNESFKGASYIVCSFDLTKDELRMYWRSNGKPYRTFAALAADLEGKGKALRFAMNGGMYQDDYRPVGLYIENGRELTPANTTTLTGAPSQIPNFYKKPNGVFYIGAGDGTISRSQTRSEFCHPVQTDAQHRRHHQSGFHREFNRSQATERCGRVESHRSTFRHYQGMGKLLRVCPFFPRRPRLQQRALSR
jgi:uncharacterized protein YigE (DUF2233 family)